MDYGFTDFTNEYNTMNIQMTCDHTEHQNKAGSKSRTAWHVSWCDHVQFGLYSKPSLFVLEDKNRTETSQSVNDPSIIKPNVSLLRANISDQSS